MSSLEVIAQQIRLMILDVDGILTSGKLLYGSNGVEYKSFHVHDGLGIKMLQKSGIPVAIITAKKSDMVARRMVDLGVHYVYQGYEDKLIAYEELKKKLGLLDKQIAYMGDDLHDLPLLRRAGLSITVANAPDIIKKHTLLKSKAKGGKGAVREICEWLMQAQNTYDSVIDAYLNR